MQPLLFPAPKLIKSQSYYNTSLGKYALIPSISIIIPAYAVIGNTVNIQISTTTFSKKDFSSIPLQAFFMPIDYYIKYKNSIFY